MKIKNKGKVYPSPSSSSSSSSDGDYLSVLKLLPAAILALASVLSLEDREVLAYLITRSIKTTTPPPTNSSTSTSSITQRKSSNKKASAANGCGNNINNNNNTHKPPVFDCDCFDCYTSYWFRWDSSPNRELIHQAIEAFEDHLTNGESEKSKKYGKAKRRDKTTRRFANNKNQAVGVIVEGTVEESPRAAAAAAVDVDVTDTSPENDDVCVAPASFPEKVIASVEDNEMVVKVSGESTAVDEEEEEEWPAVTAASAAVSSCSHKGLARKVLPDVLGLLNSRLWSLWSPNA